MKKILFISYQFPPFHGSHSTRTLNIANELAKKNEVVVLTVDLDKSLKINDFELEKKINKEIRVEKAKIGFFHNKNNNNNNLTLKKNKPFQNFIFKILKKNKDNLIIPDPVIDWYPNAIKKIREILVTWKPDQIISSATPYTNHLIGYKIAKENNIPLYLDYGDPWVYEHSVRRGKIRFIIEKKIEKQILNYAQHVFVTTNETKKLYLEKFNLKKEKVTVATMGFDPCDFKNIKTEFFKKKKLNIIYGGSLNPIHRNPNHFFEAISLLEDKVKSEIMVDIYSQDYNLYKDKLEELKIESIVKFYELISHEKFMNLLKETDILLLFGNSSSMQIPGKIFNYIGSLTKIFLINNHKEFESDETFKIIKESGENYITQNSVLEIKNEIEKIFILWKSKGIEKNVKEKSEKYSWNNTLKSLTEVINK